MELGLSKYANVAATRLFGHKVGSVLILADFMLSGSHIGILTFLNNPEIASCHEQYPQTNFPRALTSMICPLPPLYKPMEYLSLLASLYINSFKAKIFAISCGYQRNTPNRYSMKVIFAYIQTDNYNIC